MLEIQAARQKHLAHAFEIRIGPLIFKNQTLSIESPVEQIHLLQQFQIDFAEFELLFWLRSRGRLENPRRLQMGQTIRRRGHRCRAGHRDQQRPTERSDDNLPSAKAVHQLTFFGGAVGLSARAPTSCKFGRTIGFETSQSKDLRSLASVLVSLCALASLREITFSPGHFTQRRKARKVKPQSKTRPKSRQWSVRNGSESLEDRARAGNRTGSGSDRIRAFNFMSIGFCACGVEDHKLSVGPGRYRSRFRKQLVSLNLSRGL